MSDIVADLAPIVVPVATAALGYVAGHWQYRKIKAVYSKAVDALKAVRDAWEDDAITEAEFDGIVTEVGELVDELRA